LECEKTTIVTDSTNLNLTVKTIKELALKFAWRDEIKAIASEAKRSGNPIKFVFDYVYSNVVYEPDPNNIQLVKSPICTLKTKKGNCVDYSVLIGSILINLKIPFFFKTVGFDSSGSFDHIYIVTKEQNLVLDCVIGQKQDGTDTFTNRPLNGKFNVEYSSKNKKLFGMPQLQILQGYRKAKGLKPIGRAKYVRSKSDSNLKGNWLEDLGDGFSDLVNHYGEVLSNPIDAIQNSGIVETGVTAFQDIPNVVNQWGTVVSDPFKAIGNSGVFETAKSIVGTAGNLVSGLISPKKKIKKLPNGLTQTVDTYAGLEVPQIILMGGLLLGGIVFLNKSNSDSKKNKNE
jgi:hypothetical protein